MRHKFLVLRLKISYIMKKTVTLFFILSAFIQSFAQITMDITNMPVASATSNQRMAKQTTPAPIVNFGNKGANQFYNFSNLTHQQYDTILYKVPITSQRTAFPGTDDAITLDNVNYLYSKTTASKYQILGLEGKLVA